MILRFSTFTIYEFITEWIFMTIALSNFNVKISVFESVLKINWKKISLSFLLFWVKKDLIFFNVIHRVGIGNSFLSGRVACQYARNSMNELLKIISLMFMVVAKAINVHFFGGNRKVNTFMTMSSLFNLTVWYKIKEYDMVN